MTAPAVTGNCLLRNCGRIEKCRALLFLGESEVSCRSHLWLLGPISQLLISPVYTTLATKTQALTREKSRYLHHLRHYRIIFQPVFPTPAAPSVTCTALLPSPRACTAGGTKGRASEPCRSLPAQKHQRRRAMALQRAGERGALPRRPAPPGRAARLHVCADRSGRSSEAESYCRRQ